MGRGRHRPRLAYIAAMRIAVLLVSLLAAVPSLADPITTVILVRHAEKASQDEDPPLSDAGSARARELARVLAVTPIDAIYTTQYARTRQTAAPLAEASGIEARTFPAAKGYAAAMAAHIRSRHEGETVVVVGHSNSTPDVARALGATNVPKIEESQFDYLFVVTLAGDDQQLTILRYGLRTP